MMHGWFKLRSSSPITFQPSSAILVHYGRRPCLDFICKYLSYSEDLLNVIQLFA